MRVSILCLIVAAGLAAGVARGACTPIRLGYTDQALPPYYLGSGSAEASPPGATVELIREIVASTGCTVVAVRLPLARIPMALEAGLIDAAPVYLQDKDAMTFAYPRDKNGEADLASSVQAATVVFVRASDKLASDTDPIKYFKGRKLGLAHGSVAAGALRAAGIVVDDGAVDTARNLDKLKRGRIDGFAIGLASPGDMDAYIARRDGAAIVRLDKPLRTVNIWLATNKQYHARNTEQVEAMWRWIALHGRSRFSALMAEYADKQ
ncbi:MAG: transporter substrate-binding domain-containing protein [Pseudomonadota bacterium]